MTRTDREAFAELLEEFGYENARELVENELVPMARSENISLYEAAQVYADEDEDQDTSYFQLFSTLQNIPKSYIQALNIHEPL